ncbi:lipopolysaccharide biosynthesis protein [Rufibacter sediminis]
MSLKLIKSFSIYTIAGFFGTGANFFVLPILSRYLTAIDYGVQSIFNSYVLILVPLIGLVSSGYLTVEYYRVKDKKEYASLFSSVQFIPVLPFVLLLLGAVLFYKPLGSLLEIPSGSEHMVWMIVVLALLTIYIDSFFSYLVIRKKANHYFVFNVSKTCVEILFTLLLVVKYEMGWHGRIYAWLLANVLYFLITIIYFYKEDLLTFDFKKKYYIAGILYGLPLILHTIGKFVISQSDRIFIANILSIADVGFYNMAVQISSLLLIFVNIFQKIYTPFVFERLVELTVSKKIQIIQLSYAFLICLLFGLFLVTLLSPFLFGTFIDVKFKASIPYIFWITLSYVFWGLYIVFSAFIYYYRKSLYMAYIAVVNIVTNLIFNYFLIKKFGVVGAAYATSISYLITLILVFYYSNRLLPLPWFSFNFIFTKSFVQKKA